MNLHNVYRAAFRRFRPGRLRLFYTLLDVRADTRVLDLGGTAFFWNLAREMGLPAPRVTVVNLHPVEPEFPPDWEWVMADGCALPFDAGEFEVVFCNSVIEHVGTWGSQQRLAAEVRRVGRSYFVQTPDPSFPVELHLFTPFVHWLPDAWRQRLVPRFTVRGLMGSMTPEESADLRRVKLLSRRDMQALFPDAMILRERFCGFPKSLIAVRRSAEA